MPEIHPLDDQLHVVNGESDCPWSGDPEIEHEGRREPIIKKKGREKARPLETELGVSGEFARPKIPQKFRARSWATGGVNKFHLRDFGDQEDAELPDLLPGNFYFSGYDLLYETIWRRCRIKFMEIPISHHGKLRNATYIWQKSQSNFLEIPIF